MLLMLPLLSGCLNSVQLNQRAIVQAVGVDLKDDQIALTFQVFSPASSAGSSIGSTTDNAKILQVTGRTVSEAIQNANLKQGKQLFVGHNRIIIIGSALAEKGLEQPLSYFSATPWSRQNVYLALAEDKASDILSAKINQGMLPAETLQKIVENSEDNGVFKSVKLFEFLKSLQNKHNSAFLPIMNIKKEEEGAKQGEGESKQGGGGDSGEQGGNKGSSEEIDSVSSVELVGTAIFSDAKMVGKLDKNDSRGLLWIRDAIEKTQCITSSEKYQIATLNVYSSKSKIVPEVDHNRVKMTLKVDCKATLEDSMLKPGKTAEVKDIEELGIAGSELIKKECLAAFQKSVMEYHADIFNFGDLVWKANPDVWKQLSQNWSEQVPEIEFTVEANMSIDRIGLEFKRES